MKALLYLVLSFVTATTVLAQPESSEKKDDSAKGFIFFPIVYFTPETNLAGGAMIIKNFWKEREGRTSNFLGAFTYTSLNQSKIYLAPKFYFDKGNWELNANVVYSYYPNRYYGRGVNNSVPVPEDYTDNDLSVSIGGGKNLVSDLYMRAFVTHEKKRIVGYSPGGLIETEIRNYSEDMDVNSGTASLDWDERDSSESPRSGGFYKLSYTYYQPINRSSKNDLASFTRTKLDLRHYYPFATNWVGAGQVMVSNMDGDLIPFPYLNSIGGGSLLRGYYAGQYRDRSVAALQTELRWERFERWTPAVFASVARLEKDLQSLSSAKSFYSGGFGAHYMLDPESRTKIRIDIGFTGQDVGFYVLLGEAF